MRWILAIPTSFFVLMATYFGVANLSCWLNPSNLCGLIAVPCAFALATFAFILVVVKRK